jgi:NADH-quinone oxidoreductase subunit G
MLKGKPADLGEATRAAARLIANAKRPVALISSWGSNEELAAFKQALGSRFTSFV